MFTRGSNILFLIIFISTTHSTVTVEDNNPIESIPQEFYGLNWSSVIGEVVYIPDYPNMLENITGKIALVARENRPSDPGNLLRQAVFMNEIAKLGPKAVLTHSLSFFKDPGYDEWQNYGTPKDPAILPVVEVSYVLWQKIMTEIREANKSNNYTGITIKLTSEGVNLWDLTYGPGPYRAIDWVLAGMFFAVSVWTAVKFTQTTIVRRWNFNIAQVSYLLMIAQAIVMISYCVCRAMVAKVNSYTEAAIQSLFNQFIVTVLVIVAAYWTEMMGAVIPKNYITKKIQTIIAVVVATVFAAIIVCDCLIPLSYRTLPTVLISAGPAQFFIVAVWYNIAGIKLIWRLKHGGATVAVGSTRSRLLRVLITVGMVTFGLILSFVGTMMFVVFSALLFFAGAIISRLGILITFVGVVYAFKIPTPGAATAGTGSQGSQHTKPAPESNEVAMQ